MQGFSIIGLKRTLKRGLLLSVSLLSIHLYGQEEIIDSEPHHCLVEENTFSYGVGPTYSFVHEGIGINSLLYYNIGEKLCFGPEVSYFKIHSDEIVDANFVAHYIFETPWVGVFPVVGINYTMEKTEHKEEGAFGVLFGIGVHRNVKNFTFLAEYDYISSDLKDQFVKVGLIYRFKL